MKVFIYANDSKPKSENFVKTFSDILVREKVDFKVVDSSFLLKKATADAVFVYGGDGTILALTKFCSENSIPVIGFNAGKLGFLSEFEISEAENAVKLLKSGELKNDVRSILKISVRGKVFYALNDAVVQRTYNEESDGRVISVSVFINEYFVDEITGDGVIVSTPTGSTAYSLSAGGAILSPGINAFIITPLSAHSLHQRPVVFSANSVCTVKAESENATLFIDGKRAALLNSGDVVKIEKASKNLAFLRKPESNFYRRLDDKLNK